MRTVLALILLALPAVAAPDRAASRKLCLEPGKNLEALKAGAASEDPVVALRCRATLALADEPEVAALVTALGSGERSVREDAAAKLGEMGPAAEHAVPALVVCYEVTGGSYVVTQALQGVHRGLLRATPLLLAELERGNEGVGAAVLERLAWNGPAGGEAVAAAALRALENPRLRVSAAVALASVAPEDPRTLAALTKALDDPEARVREIAARSLGELGLLAEPAVPALTARLADDAKEVRVRAADALGRIGKRDPAALAGLVDCLRGEDNGLAVTAAGSLARLGPPPQAVPRLQELVGLVEEWRRDWVIAALWRALPAAECPLKILIETAEGAPLRDFREEAREELRRMAVGDRVVELLPEIDRPAVREALEASLRREPTPEELKVLRRMAEEGNQYASRRLARLRPVVEARPAYPTVPLLLARAREGDVSSVAALGQIAPYGDPDTASRVARALALLLDAADDEVPGEDPRAFRIAAVTALGRMDDYGVEAAAALVRSTKSEDRLLRIRAAEAIKKARGVCWPDDPIVDLLIEEAARPGESPYDDERYVAVQVLGEIGAMRATPLLFKILTEAPRGPAAPLQSAAGEALRKIWSR